MVVKLILNEIHTDKELKLKQGKYLDEDIFIKKLINEDTDAYDNKGNLIFKFRKKVIVEELKENGWNSFEKPALQNSNSRGGSAGKIDIDGIYFNKYIKDLTLIKKNGYDYNPYHGSKMTKQVPVYSTALGNYDVQKRFGVEHPCRMTLLTKKFYNNMVQGIPYLQKLSDTYKDLKPDKWEEQYNTAKKGNWNIGDTAFSTITINKNFQTAVHKDKGDFGGWGVLSVLEDGKYEGGYFMLPNYEVGIDIRDGDVLVADVHKYHTNSRFWTTPEQDKYNDVNLKRYINHIPTTPIKGSEFKFTRLSFVCYLRSKMGECKDECFEPIKQSIPYKIVIPSYQRSKELKLKTLLFLNNHKIKNKDIFIFIRSDDNKLDDYMLLKNEGYNIVVTNNVKGIGRTHNYITKYFEPDEFIIELDDDVLDIINKDKQSITNFEEEMMLMKDKMIENKLSYGGLYSCPNTYFMKKENFMDDYTYNLRYCLGLCRLRFIRKDVVLQTNYCEDFENNILYYIRDGGILRNNTIVGITKNYALGGCNGDGRTNETERIDKQFLADTYPEYCRLYVRKNGKTDLRLKHYKSKKSSK